MDVQKSFGEFIRDQVGPNWVYAARSSDRLHARYDKPDCPAVVITPKQQRQLARDYRAIWGREHDPEFWQMLCALRSVKNNLKLWGYHADHVYEEVCAAIKAATEETGRVG